MEPSKGGRVMLQLDGYKNLLVFQESCKLGRRSCLPASVNLLNTNIKNMAMFYPNNQSGEILFCPKSQYSELILTSGMYFY